MVTNINGWNDGPNVTDYLDNSRNEFELPLTLYNDVLGSYNITLQ